MSAGGEVGRLGERSRPLLDIRFRTRDGVEPREAWIDTGFDGELGLPAAEIDAMGLERSRVADAVLADGSRRELATYSASIEWCGRVRAVEVIAGEGANALLGNYLFAGRTLTIDYDAHDVRVA